MSCGKKKLFLQSQGHSEGLYDQNMTIFTISSKLLVDLQPNLVWWCIFLMQCVMRKFWFTIFSATKFSLMVHHHKLESFVKKIRLLFLRSRSLLKFKTLLNLYASYIFCTIDLWTAKEGVLIYSS